MKSFAEHRTFSKQLQGKPETHTYI